MAAHPHHGLLCNHSEEWIIAEEPLLWDLCTVSHQGEKIRRTRHRKCALLMLIKQTITEPPP